jgi:hypothetical protein
MARELRSAGEESGVDYKVLIADLHFSDPGKSEGDPSQ